MQLTLPASTLAESLATIAPALGKSDVRALAKLSLHNSSGLTFSATDGELAIVHRGPLTGGESGDCMVVPGRLKALADLVSGDVTLSAGEDMLAIKAGADDFTLPISDPSAWPDIAEPKGKPTFSMPASEVKSALERVTFAAGGESEKYTTSGTIIELDDERLHLAATDGKRLAWWRTKCEGKAIVAILPQRAIRVLQSLDGETCEAWLSANLATFRVGNTTLTTTLIEGNPAPFRDIVPKPKQVKASVELTAGEFRNAVERAALMTDDESKRIDFAFTAGNVTMKARGATSGAATVVLPLLQGADFAIAFDPDSLVGRAGLLRPLDADERITLDLVASDKTATFRSGREWCCAVVPLA